MTPTPPLTLGIEVSNPALPGKPGIPENEPRSGVAIARIEAGRVALLARETVRAASRQDDDLIPSLDRLFRRAGCAPSDLGAIAVSVGPGGFTGLRVAVAAAKMIAEVTGARCIGVPTTRALIRRVDTGLRVGRETAILLAWKRDDVWLERYSPCDTTAPESEGRLTRFDRLDLKASSLVIADDQLISELRSRGLIPPGAAIGEPRFDPLAVIEASTLMPPVDPCELMPIYPREPEAATKWRELKARQSTGN